MFSANAKGSVMYLNRLRSFTVVSNVFVICRISVSLFWQKQ